MPSSAPPKLLEGNLKLGFESFRFEYRNKKVGCRSFLSFLTPTSVHVCLCVYNKHWTGLPNQTQKFWRTIFENWKKILMKTKILPNFFLSLFLRIASVMTSKMWTKKSLTKFNFFFLFLSQKTFSWTESESYKFRETPEGLFYDKNVLRQNIPKRVKMK